MNVKLIVGLGNPGPEYRNTRHNVGFDVLDRLARRVAPGAIARSRFGGVVLEGQIGEHKSLLLKPLTFMNRSGQAVAEAVRFYKLEVPEDVMVIVDDVALACGSIRLRPNGSSGGHNGLADIEQKLASDTYARLRIGIDAPGQIPQRDYVLGRFRPDQTERLEPALDTAVDAVTCWATLGISESMNRFNRKNIA
ncbi:MAG: aminoacyl-tRNA hydrolase [Phycisphaerales bacterium]